MNHRRALVALGLSALAVTVAPSIASASEAYTQTLGSTSENLGGYHIGGSDSLGLASFDVDVAAKASWSSPLQTVVGWDDGKVRQGADLAVGRSVSPLSLGTLKVRWTVSGSVKPKGLSTVNFGTKAIGDDASCSLQTLGGNYTCVAFSNGVPLVKTPGLPASPYVKLALKATFNITPEGVITNRTLSVDGDNAGSASNLPLGVLPAGDTVKLPCTAPMGATVGYRLSSYRWTPAVSATQQPTVQIGIMDPILGLAESPALYDHAFGPAVHSNPTFELTASGHTYDMGALKFNSVAPTLAAPVLSGKVGVPVALAANASGPCEIVTAYWKFDNGAVEHGEGPLSRTFSAPGVYKGEVTVTDASSAQTKRDFTITITK